MGIFLRTEAGNIGVVIFTETAQFESLRKPLHVRQPVNGGIALVLQAHKVVARDGQTLEKLLRFLYQRAVIGQPVLAAIVRKKRRKLFPGLVKLPHKGGIGMQSRHNGACRQA